MRLSKILAIVVIAVVVIFFIGVGILVGVRLTGGSGVDDASLSPYSAVYLSTGDVYFGKLEWSPSPHIEDPWFLQRGTDGQGQPTLGVFPFSQVAWGPSNEIYFNSQQIIFWTRLSNTSTIAQAIANPSATAVQQNIPPAQVPVITTTTPTSTANPSPLKSK